MVKFNIAWIPVLKSWQYSKMEDVEIPAKKTDWDLQMYVSGIVLASIQEALRSILDTRKNIQKES